MQNAKKKFPCRLPFKIKRGVFDMSPYSHPPPPPPPPLLDQSLVLDFNKGDGGGNL